MEENKNTAPATTETSVALADEQRVKVMSPGMMVYKRFIRNKLAITGLAVLITMFLFSFVGSFLYPYGQAEVFKSVGSVALDYAVATYSTDLRFTEADGKKLPNSARSQFMLAVSNGTESFSDENVEYTIVSDGTDFYRIGGYTPLIEADVLRKAINYKPSDQMELTAVLKTAFEAAYLNGDDTFEYNGNTYYILRKPRWCAIAEYSDFAVASRRIIDVYDTANTNIIKSFDFRLAAESALLQNQSDFEYGGLIYTLSMLDEDNGTIYDESGNPFAEIANIVVNPADSEIFLPVAFKQDVRDAVIHNLLSFDTDTAIGQQAHYNVHRINAIFYVKTETPTELINIFDPPSTKHLLGTDPNGMDMLARLMYGGRVSLTVGFIVIIIELLIGVTLGGIAGYFGNWVDMLLMRFVDLFNTLPVMPLLIILASILDAYHVEPMKRIYLLMLILGILGWTGIARVVRGQILSLREQDFMVAAEASGLSVFRRIFKHLVPNVMPLLIVNATMGLGDIILTEATLSFLGLGIKYPLSSWGTIANNATSVNIMTYYPWTWIPAGLLIFITVLGFNFIGDGLRDAFDPKMKR